MLFIHQRFICLAICIVMNFKLDSVSFFIVRENQWNLTQTHCKMLGEHTNVLELMGNKVKENLISGDNITKKKRLKKRSHMISLRDKKQLKVDFGFTTETDTCVCLTHPQPLPPNYVLLFKLLFILNHFHLCFPHNYYV